MAITKCEQFFSLLKKSELLSGEPLEKAEQFSKEEANAKALARRLLKEEVLTKWQANMLLAGKHTLRLGKYKLLEQVGSGGLNHVHLAQHHQMGRRVALKTLSRRQMKNPESVNEFLTEARRVAALDHANIIRVYDIDSQGERYFLVMEYVEGHDLRSVVEKNGPLSAAIVADYIRQAAAGLAYAHQREITRRDIKPANLLVDEQGTIKILNLGVTSLGQSQIHNGDDDKKESADDRYLSPEQTTDGAAADHRSDIYSLGCTCYYLLTGQAPPIVGHKKPPALEDICSQMMAAKPEDRFQSAEEVVKALESWLSGFRAARQSQVVPLEHTAVGDHDALPQFSIELNDREPATVANDFSIDLDGAAAMSESADVVESEEETAFASLPEAEADDAEEAKSIAQPKKPRVGLIIAGGTTFSSLVTIAGIVLLVLLLGWVWKKPNSTNADDKPIALAKSGKKNPSDKTKESKDDNKDGGNNKDNPVKPTDPLPKDGQPKDNPPPVEPPKEKPKDPPKDPPKEKPKDPPKTDPKPPPPKDPKPDPKPKPKPPVPKPKPKPQSPFRSLAAAVELPVLESDADAAALTPVELGPVLVKPDELFFIELSGGDKALRGSQTFTMSPASAPRQWDIKLHKSTKIKTPDTTVANVSLEGQKLMFRWTENAKLDPLANHLRNCVLSMRTGTQRQQLALRQPLEVEALAIQFAKPMKAVAGFSWPPNATALMVEIYGLDDKKTPHKVDPRKTMLANKGTTNILLGAEPQILFFTIDSSLRSGVQLTANTYYKLPRFLQPRARKSKPIKYKPGLINQWTKEIIDRQDFFKKQNDKFKKAKNQQQAAIAKNNFDQLQKFGNRLAQLVTYQQALDGKGHIHFRVYYTAGQYQVDLARSAGAPAPVKKK